ncbi:MAG: tRNA lysidine(34) synthetase TilS [Patescibacteria group bacterium]
MSNFLNQIPDNAKLLLALSGGPDSIYLLHQLLSLRAKKNIVLNLAHFNHNTRGQASDNDASFVKKISDQYNLPITIKKRRNRSNFSPDKTHFSEEKLRQLRYAFLEKTRLKTKSDFIITAHTLDDQIETIIFNFIRGTGPQGLTGMTFQKNNILRPLLDTPKSTILKYLYDQKIPFCCDESNQNTEYTRNYIRQIIIPQISKINPNYHQSITQLSQTVTNQQNFINQETIETLKKISLHSITPIKNWKLKIGNLMSTAVRSREGKTGNWKLKIPEAIIQIDLKKFNRLHPALKSQIIHYLISPLVPTNKQISFKQISEINHILKNSRGGSQKILFNTLSIAKKNDKITLYKL